MNSVHLIGNLVENPKITVTANGIAKCVFRIAVTRRYVNQQGEREADFLTIVAWRKLAENCGKFLAKGRKCAIQGSIQTRSYEANDGGGKRYVTEIIADDVEFLGAKTQEKSDATPNSKSNADDSTFTEIDDADLPF